MTRTHPLQASNPLFSSSLLACAACGATSEDTLTLYRALLEAGAGGRGLEEPLLKDLRILFAEDCGALVSALPCVLKSMPNEAVGNHEVIQSLFVS